MLFADFPNSKFWFPEFVSSYAWHVTASIYPYFVDADSKGSGESADLQGLSEPSFLDTAMSTSTKSNMPAHLIYSLLLVII